ncbi:MAG: quinone-dependent dihydroorotate dehydrogenase [Nitrospinota bacterium]|nr:MAG: quinone-dependent dihydroorotate dehydrogenase [Nitrospinota bacterium]
MLYTSLFRPFLFRQDPEAVHELVIRLLEQVGKTPLLSGCLRRCFSVEDRRLVSTVMGLRFPNPVGLAAGFDKNGRLVRSIPLLGFGFMEIGTVTAHPQAGNPRPRLFRLPADQALINRMGFNNAGADAVAKHLEQAGKPPIPLGINIGKSKIVPLSQAVADYLYSFERLYPWGDFFVVNVSSPNTPGLRQLQEGSLLGELLHALQEQNIQLATQAHHPPKPLLVKIAPDLVPSQLDAIVDVVAEQRIAGIVATNTTVARNGLTTALDEAGGLSGRPLRQRSTAIIRYLFQRTEGRIPIIGVGGIFSAADAWEKILAGASLVQVYTGLIYEGPSLVRHITRGLCACLSAAGLQTVTDAVGQDACNPENTPR